jgi:S1-C subfamily serine protease
MFRARARSKSRVLLAGLLVVIPAGVTVYLRGELGRLQATLASAESARADFEKSVELERRRGELRRRSLEARVQAAQRREQELRVRVARKAGDQELRALREELLQLRGRLHAIEGASEAGERIIRDYGGGVCLIQGAYAYYDEQGRPLRYKVDEDGEKIREADGSVAVDVEGDGPIHSVDAIGTGFLAEKGGLVVTNRHVVEPWWKNDTAATLAKGGYKPRLLVLRAFFPRVEQPLKLEVERVSSVVDLAVVRVELGGRRIPALPLDASSRGAVPGQPVVVVGYPTGLEAILAKAETSVVQQILSSQGGNTERVTEALSRRGLIRPSTTQGHIGDVTSTDIVFDAATTQGGSGGPVFNKQGRVIAIEYATLPAFSGNSYGLPARYALELLEAPRS